MSTGETGPRHEEWSVEAAPTAIKAALKPFEERFAIEFATVSYFPPALFDEIHRIPDGGEVPIPPGVTVASQGDPSILEDMKVLRDVANDSSSTEAQHAQYFAALRNVYAKLERLRGADSYRKTVFGVAPEREGRILANATGWNRFASEIAYPHAKRISFEKGLLVALNEIGVPESADSCLLIDGAIASGATLLALIARLRTVAPVFDVVSVHATCEGLWGLHRYGRKLGVDVRIAVGHVTRGMSPKYYAIDTGANGALIIGDIGDHIHTFG